MSDIHPSAIVDKKAQLGSGVRIGPYSIIGPNVVLADGVIVENHVTISGHTTLGKKVHVFPGAVIGGVPQDLKYRGEPTTLTVGDNTVIRECATLHIGTELGGGKTVIGSDNLIMAYVHVAHDCVLGSRIVIANGTQLAGHVHVEDGARLSGLVAVHHFVRIGTCSFVAGCAKLSIDVPPFTLAEGHPARIRGLNREGLKRRGMTPEAHESLKEAYRLCFRSELSQEQAFAEITNRGGDKVAEVAMFVEFLKAVARGKHGRALEAEREVIPAEERDGRLGFKLPSGQKP
ncbi:MAG TPA: acyl-ACP--UDP-N-acetylglucosamine O-acyltransferase [Planctomycetota bacterium]|nr:acyl-ACP--UDP-N-acetylglucosamine O-acyltransferase [Planctomycetota bacterium]